MRFLRNRAILILALMIAAACKVDQTTFVSVGVSNVSITLSDTTITECPANVTITVTVQGSGTLPEATVTASGGELVKSGTNSWRWTTSTNGTYTVTATAGGKTSTATITVNCGGGAQPGDVSLQASPMNIVQGQSSTLSWGAANVTSCSASAVPATSEWSGSRQFNGSQLVYPAVTTDYTLTCIGLDGLTYRASVRVVVTVPSGVIITPSSLNLYPPTCPSAGPSTGTLSATSNGASVVVSWSSSNPSVTSVNPTSGSSTTITAHAPGSTTITATGANGQTATATVVVNNCPSSPTVISVVVSPSNLNLFPSACPSSGPSTGQLTATVTVTGGASQAVTWSSSNNSVVSVSSSGLVTVVGTGTATITVRSVADPSKYATATVTVNSCPTALILLFSASPTEITRGQSSTLSWSTQGATSCTASGGWSGAKAVSGSQSVSPTVTTTYTLTCVGQGTSVTRSVEVRVNEPASVVSVTIQPDTARCSVGGQVNFGASVTVTGNASTGVSWSVGNTAIASFYQQSNNQATFNCRQVGTTTVTARSTHDTSKFATAVIIVVPGTMSCTWTPSSGLQSDGSVRLSVGQVITATGQCVNEHGQSFLPYWYSSAPSRVGVRADQTVVINGTTFYAGNNATITAVAAGEAMVCIQSSISQTSPAYCRRVVVQ